MSLSEERTGLPDPFWRALARKDVLAGLLFIVVAVLGLWISRDYPIGTALRMGTGYVPRKGCAGRKARGRSPPVMSRRCGRSFS